MLLVVSRVKAQLSISILGFESRLTEIFLQVNRHVVVYSAEARELASPPPDPGVHGCVCVSVGDTVGDYCDHRDRGAGSTFPRGGVGISACFLLLLQRCSNCLHRLPRSELVQ